MSVLGCNDIHQAAFVTPPLTTIRTPLYELGERCCKLMVDLLRGAADQCRERMPVELKIRQSTAPPSPVR